MTRHLIHHNGARTRALYQWETEEIFLDKRNLRFDQKSVDKFVTDFWKREGRIDQRAPRVYITMYGEFSECLGRAEIKLHLQESGPVILVHELIHAKGYGSGKQMHPVSFVRDYLRCLSIFVGFNHSELKDSAMMRGLL